MCDDNAAQEAADIIWRHWRAGTHFAALPDACRPTTRAEGYAIQARQQARGDGGLLGWKIAATSAAGQKHIVVDGPLAGRILPWMQVAEGATVPLGSNRMLVAEPEFAFRMARDLPPRAEPYTQAEVMDAVAALHLAIELPESRFLDFTIAGAAQLIADNACAHLWMLGPEAPPIWRDLDLAAHRVVGWIEGGVVRDGAGANVLGDPRIALAWLVNELSRHGTTLIAGAYVTTGTCVVPLPIRAGDVMRADFGILGSTSLRFSA